MNPKVSIIIITYNHENYITKTIESILLQEYKGEIEVWIGDDNSSDNTPQIIKTFEETYPRILRSVLFTEKKGGNFIYKYCYNKCNGKYIAFCEGDDYWSDNLKIQKQIHFLEKNPDYILCYTDIQHFIQDKREFKSLVQKGIDTINIKDLMVKNYVTTLTVMYRNRIVDLDESFTKLSVGDWPLYVLLSQYGKIKRLPFISGVYRVHNNNNFFKNDYLQKKKKITEATEFLYKSLNKENQGLAKNKLINNYFILSVLYIQTQQLELAYAYYYKLKMLCAKTWHLRLIQLKLRLFIYKCKNLF